MLRGENSPTGGCAPTGYQVVGDDLRYDLPNIQITGYLVVRNDLQALSNSIKIVKLR